MATGDLLIAKGDHPSVRTASRSPGPSSASRASTPCMLIANHILFTFHHRVWIICYCLRKYGAVRRGVTTSIVCWINLLSGASAIELQVQYHRYQRTIVRHTAIWLKQINRNWKLDFITEWVLKLLAFYHVSIIHLELKRLLVSNCKCIVHRLDRLVSRVSNSNCYIYLLNVSPNFLQVMKQALTVETVHYRYIWK